MINMKRLILSIVTFVTILLIASSCYYDNEEALYPSLNSSCDTTNVTFSGTIWPIMQNTCTGCHGTAPYSGGVPFRDYADVSAAAANGSLLNSLKGNGVTKMPPGGSLTACRIRVFEIWINNGHLNN